MGKKKGKLYDSSSQALLKLLILFLTLMISVAASLLDTASCYITIIVQAINNCYDFYPFAENKKYSRKIKNESIGVLISAILAIIASIVALFGKYAIMNQLFVRLICIFLVALPLLFIYNDYKFNVRQENEEE